MASVARAPVTLATLLILSIGSIVPVAISGGMSIEEEPMRDFKLADDLTFTYGETLGGIIRGGEEHGIELSRGFDGRPVTREKSLNLEHYFSTSRAAGLLVPRKGTKRIEKLDDRRVRIEIGEHGGWKVTGEIIYTFMRERVIRADFTMTFGEEYLDFNTLVSVYFHEETMPYLRIDGRWEQARLQSPQEHRFWCRSARDLESFMRGLPAMNADYAAVGFPELIAVDDRVWGEPVMVNTIRDTGWAVILWFDDEVRSVSANTRWKAHDFSIGGRDVKPGETLKSTVWMGYRELENMDDALQPMRWDDRTSPGTGWRGGAVRPMVSRAAAGLTVSGPSEAVGCTRLR